MEKCQSKHTVSRSSRRSGDHGDTRDKFIWTRGIIDEILRMCLSTGTNGRPTDFATPSCTYQFYDNIISRANTMTMTSWTAMKSAIRKNSRPATEGERKTLRYFLSVSFFHNLSHIMEENRLSKESQSSIEPSTTTETRIVSDFEKLPKKTGTHSSSCSETDGSSSLNETPTAGSSSCSANGGSSSVHPLNKSESNFLSKTLRIMNPVEAAQPFWSYGFDVKLVENMNSMFMLEGVSMENFVSWEEIDVCEDAVKVAEFLERLCKDRLESHPDEHFMKTVALSIDEYIEKEDDLWIDEFLEKYTKKNPLIKLFWKRLQAGCDRGLDTLNKNNLKDFVSNLLSIDEMTCINEHMLVLNPFNISKDRIGQKCYTDIKCISEMSGGYFGVTKGKVLRRAFSIPISIELKAFMQTICESFGKSCTKSVHIGVRLLWQVLEQCLGNMIEAAYETEGKTKVFQASVIIVGNKVRNVVLCMDANSYEQICELNNAEGTIKWMYTRCLEDKMDSWCKVYIDCHEVSITDSNRLARYSCVNFCRAL